MDVKMVPYVKENKSILNILLDMCILLSDIAIVDHFSVLVTFVVFPDDTFTWFCPYAFINRLASNYAI